MDLSLTNDSLLDDWFSLFGLLLGSRFQVASIDRRRWQVVHLLLLFYLGHSLLIFSPLFIYLSYLYIVHIIYIFIIAFQFIIYKQWRK